MEAHEKLMERCIELARNGAGNVSPNPMVGALVFHQGRVIGEGFHRQCGGHHAEVNAIHAALKHIDEADLQKSVLYVCLEPCAHQGKTPPCTDFLIQHGIRKVVIGCHDPNPAVNGKGVQRLQEAGIEVIAGVLQKKCVRLNKRFFTYVQQKRPYMVLKWAQTADGFFAPESGFQKWISSHAARVLTHRWRTEEDAILIGKNTALADDPQLTARYWVGKNPLRIVIDQWLTLPRHLQVFDHSASTLVFNALVNKQEKGIQYIQLKAFGHDIPKAAQSLLYAMSIQSVLIEGGKQTLQWFIDAEAWDEARIITSPIFWGAGVKSPVINGQVIQHQTMGNEQLCVLSREPF